MNEHTLGLWAEAAVQMTTRERAVTLDALTVAAHESPAKVTTLGPFREEIARVQSAIVSSWTLLDLVEPLDCDALFQSLSRLEGHVIDAQHGTEMACEQLSDRHRAHRLPRSRVDLAANLLRHHAGFMQNHTVTVTP